jgi:hypothetical protein
VSTISRTVAVVVQHGLVGLHPGVRAGVDGDRARERLRGAVGDDVGRDQRASQGVRGRGEALELGQLVALVLLGRLS